MFEIEFNEMLNQWIVKEKETGWFFPTTTKIQAETLCDKFNELSKEIETLTSAIEDYKFQAGERHL